MSKICENFGGQVNKTPQQIGYRLFERRGVSEHRSLQQRNAQYRLIPQRSASEYRNRMMSDGEFHIPHSAEGYQQKRETFYDYNESIPFQSSLTLNNFPVTDGAKSPSKDSMFLDFYERVNCPFCLEIQKDKTAFVKHLDDRCKRKKGQQKMLFSIFQILPNNLIKCNVCPSEVFCSIGAYLQHLTWEDHILNCSLELKRRQLTDFIYCSSCQVKVPDNVTQLYSHLEHMIHDIRRKSHYTPDYCTKKGIYCIYCFFSGEKVFKCLACPRSKSLFFSVPLVTAHFKTEDHLKNVKHYVNHSVYCSFCNEEFNTYETPFHMASIQHIESEKLITTKTYELCFYCGFSCSNLTELFSHMMFNCNEIIKIRQKQMEKTNGKDSSKMKQNGSNAVAAQGTSKLSLKTDRCILVKGNVDILKLIRILKEIGPISFVDEYDPHNVAIEFESKSSLDTIRLIQNVIKIDGEKVEVKFLEEGNGGNPTMTKTMNKPE